jgi:hypothetical protein
MMRSALLLVVALFSGIDRLEAQEAVEARGITSSIKLEETLYGHMEEINGLSALNRPNCRPDTN